MSQLLFCLLRRRHWPRMHRGARFTICMRCYPCLTCGGTTEACIGPWCVMTASRS